MPKLSRSEKIKRNKQDKRIESLYGKYCSGVAINVMDIGKVFEEGYRWMDTNPTITDEALGAALRAYVDMIAA